MKNLFLIISLVCYSFLSEAQTKAIPLNFHGVDVYAMMSPVNPFTQVGQITFMSEHKELSNTEWLNAVVQLAPVLDFDAIVTRNGQHISYIQYKSKDAERIGYLTNLKVNYVDVFYFSKPNKGYTVIGKQTIENNNTSATFYTIIDEYTLRKFKLKYDAIIVGENEVQYIAYNL